MNLPLDNNGHTIQALGVRDDGAHEITVSGTSARNSTAFDTKTNVLWLYSTTDLHFKTGGADTTATTTDHFLPAGIRVPLPKTASRQYIAVIQASASGTLYISEGA